MVSCSKNGCDLKSADKCGYCGLEYCKEHLPARIVTNLKTITEISKDMDYLKFKKYNEDWQAAGGHACVKYTERWNDWYDISRRYGDTEDEPQAILVKRMSKSEIEDARERLQAMKEKEPKPKTPKSKNIAANVKKTPEPKKESVKEESKPGPTKTENKEACTMPPCKREVVYSCQYCGRRFCKFHINHLIATTKEEIDSLSRSGDVEKYEKYLDDWEIKNGHPCIEYTERWNRERKKPGLLKRIKDGLGFID